MQMAGFEGAMSSEPADPAQRNRAILSVACGAALIAFAPIGMRLSEVGPQATAFWRFAFALPILAALAFALPREKAPHGLAPRMLGLLIVAGLFFGLELGLWHIALGLTSVVNATLASNMTPLIVAAAGFVLFKERVTRAFLLGAAVAISGAGLLSAARAGEVAGSASLIGDLFGLASALGYAVYLILVGRARRTVDVRTVMLVTTAAAAVYAFAAAHAFGETFWPQTWKGWAVVAALGVITQVGGQGLIAAGLGRLPLAIGAVVLWVQPVTAAGLSWGLFGEALGPMALAGAALVLGGVWIAQRGKG
jgi:drug/metabolite transporter (DMT)-like permease